MQKDVLVPNITPSPKQELFLTSSADETFFGGAAGGGKSAALIAEAITASIEDEAHHTYIFRRTLKELNQSEVPELLKQLDVFRDNVKYNSQQSLFTFPNKSIIQLAYLDNEADKYRYQSAEIHTLLFDELTHFTQDQYEYLKTRVRSDKKRLMRIMSASNPGNIGHGWVKSYFIDGHRPMEVFKEESSGITKMYIPATIEDHPNPDFRASYRKQLEALSDEKLKKALLHGDWDIFAGQVFNEWRRHKHVFSRLPVHLEDCILYCGLDWGYNDPTAVYWVAVSPDQHFYVYRELYANNKRPEEWAYELAIYLKHEKVKFLAMPHDTYSNLGGTRPIVDQFREVFAKLGIQVNIIKSAPGTHIAKVNRQALMHHMLGDMPDGRARLSVHESCVNLIRTLPMLPYSDTNVEEIESKGVEDHAYDALSYICYAITGGYNQTKIVNLLQPEGNVPKGLIISEDMQTKVFNLDDIVLQAGKNNNKDWRYT